MEDEEFSRYDASAKTVHEAYQPLMGRGLGQSNNSQLGIGNVIKRDQSITEILTEAQRNIHTALEIAKDIKVRVVAPKPQPVTAQGDGNSTKDRNLNDDALTLRATSHALLSALEAINGAL